MSNAIRQQAREDFSKARNKALLYEIQNFLTPQRSRMLSLSDVKKALKPSGEVYVGMRSVPVSRIVGSEGRYNDFDSRFLPKSAHLRQRWSRVDEAHLADVVLPPIALYELGGLYFVRDGNHRVSVARAQGVSFIDAEVTSLVSEIRLPEDVTPESLRREVVSYEKRLFYAETSFGDITDDWSLDFTEPGSYDAIYEHIQMHRFFLCETSDGPVGIPAAVLSWFDSVYKPVLELASGHKLIRKFPKRTAGDLYIWIVREWDELRLKYGADFPLEEVPKELDEGDGKGGLLRRIAGMLGGT